MRTRMILASVICIIGMTGCHPPTPEPVVEIRTVIVTPTDSTSENSKSVKPDTESKFELTDKASLYIPSGALDTESEIYFGKQTVDIEKLPPLDGNPIALSDFYDIRSSNGDTNKPVTITLPFDKNRLPANLTDDEIRRGMFLAVPKDKYWISVPGIVDLSNQTITTVLSSITDPLVMWNFNFVSVEEIDPMSRYITSQISDPKPDTFLIIEEDKDRNNIVNGWGKGSGIIDHMVQASQFSLDNDLRLILSFYWSENKEYFDCAESAGYKNIASSAEYKIYPLVVMKDGRRLPIQFENSSPATINTDSSVVKDITIHFLPAQIMEPPDSIDKLGFLVVLKGVNISKDGVCTKEFTPIGEWYREIKIQQNSPFFDFISIKSPLHEVTVESPTSGKVKTEEIKPTSTSTKETPALSTKELPLASFTPKRTSTIPPTKVPTITNTPTPLPPTQIVYFIPAKFQFKSVSEYQWGDSKGFRGGYQCTYTHVANGNENDSTVVVETRRECTDSNYPPTTYSRVVDRKTGIGAPLPNPQPSDRKTYRGLNSSTGVVETRQFAIGSIEVYLVKDNYVNKWDTKKGFVESEMERQCWYDVKSGLCLYCYEEGKRYFTGQLNNGKKVTHYDEGYRDKNTHSVISIDGFPVGK